MFKSGDMSSVVFSSSVTEIRNLGILILNYRLLTILISLGTSKAIQILGFIIRIS